MIGKVVLPIGCVWLGIAILLAFVLNGMIYKPKSLPRKETIRQYAMFFLLCLLWPYYFLLLAVSRVFRKETRQTIMPKRFGAFGPRKLPSWYQVCTPSQFNWIENRVWTRSPRRMRLIGRRFNREVIRDVIDVCENQEPGCTTDELVHKAQQEIRQKYGFAWWILPLAKLILLIVEVWFLHSETIGQELK